MPQETCSLLLCIKFDLVDIRNYWIKPHANKFCIGFIFKCVANIPTVQVHITWHKTSNYITRVHCCHIYLNIDFVRRQQYTFVYFERNRTNTHSIHRVSHFYLDAWIIREICIQRKKCVGWQRRILDGCDISS